VTFYCDLDGWYHEECGAQTEIDMAHFKMKGGHF